MRKKRCARDTISITHNYGINKKMVRTMHGEVLIKHGPFDLHALEKW